MNPSTNRISGLLQGGVVALTALTAAIHLWLSLGFLDSGGLIFVLNGLGYLALLFLFSDPLPRRCTLGADRRHRSHRDRLAVDRDALAAGICRQSG